MKRIFLCIIMLLTLSAQLQTFEKLKPHPKPVPKITPFVAYLFFKEIFYVKFILNWWLDSDKAEKSAVYCCACDFKINSMYLYGCFVAMGDTNKVAKLKKLLYGSTDEAVSEYLLKISLEEEFECPRCLDYCGWMVKLKE